jgi:4-amino-4-deoxy-L-arabinose transferase-like glycosyltransferase
MSRSPLSFERKLLGAAVLAWLAIGISNLVLDPWFGYDEAAFAAVARGDAAAFWLYRSRGVVTLAQAGLQLGESAWMLRLPFLVLDLALPLAVYLAGRAAFDTRTGAWSAAVVVTSHQLLAQNGYVLGDVPATAGIVLGVAIACSELSREGGPRGYLVFAAPAFAGAFYCRYGSVPVITAACLLAPIIWWRGVRARPLVVLATGALLALLLIPHVAHSLRMTGSILGVLQTSAGVPRRAYLGEGLVTYITTNPFRYYGVLVAPCLVAAFVGVVRRPNRAKLYLVLVALAQIFAIGLQSHAQPRYIFVATTLLAIVGVDALRHARRASTRIALVVVAVSWLGAAYSVLVRAASHDDSRLSIVAAARVIQRDADRPCLVIAHSVPELVWATKCDVVQWYPGIQPLTLDPPRALYIVQTAIGGPIAGSGTELATAHAKARVWKLR